MIMLLAANLGTATQALLGLLWHLPSCVLVTLSDSKGIATVSTTRVQRATKGHIPALGQRSSPADLTGSAGAGDKVGLEGRPAMGRTGRRPPASAGSKRVLRPANSVFHTNSRPASGIASQRRPSTCKFSNEVNQQAQVYYRVQACP